MTIAIRPPFSKISSAVNWFKGSPPLNSRNAILDELRAIAILNMIAYHFCYCAVKIYGADWSWFSSFGVGAWQEYICCSFLFIAGFCSRFSKRPYKRAFKIALCAFLITFVTYLFNAKGFVIFGILHCMALSMFIVALFSKLIEKIPPAFGVGASLAFALIVWNTTKGYFGFSDFSLALPAVLYETDALFILGMKTKSFKSIDYFPLFPYLFVFLTGAFMGANCDFLPSSLFKRPIGFLTFLGGHSLLIYMIHQPIIIFLIYLYTQIAR